jgi:hypothetical protein
MTCQGHASLQEREVYTVYGPAEEALLIRDGRLRRAGRIRIPGRSFRRVVRRAGEIVHETLWRLRGGRPEELCRIRGHRYEVQRVVGPDAGWEEFSCLRCGHGGRIVWY